MTLQKQPVKDYMIAKLQQLLFKLSQNYSEVNYFLQINRYIYEPKLGEYLFTTASPDRNKINISSVSKGNFITDLGGESQENSFFAAILQIARALSFTILLIRQLG